MADEPTGTDNSGAKKKEPGGDADFAKFASVAGAVITVLVGLNVLTGFNPLKDILTDDSPTTTTPMPTLTANWTPTEVPEPPPVVTPEPTFELEPEPSPPYFIVESQQWDGPCDNGCAMTAIFRNAGGDGSATATFDVSSMAGEYLASCSVVVPFTTEGDAASAGCTAYNSALQYYFYANPGGQVTMSVTVNNP